MTQRVYTITIDYSDFRYADTDIPEIGVTLSRHSETVAIVAGRSPADRKRLLLKIAAIIDAAERKEPVG